MAGPSTNSTFKQGDFSNTTGVDSTIQQLTVEIVSAVPPDLTATSPRMYYNTTDGTLSIIADGVLRMVTLT